MFRRIALALALALTPTACDGDEPSTSGFGSAVPGELPCEAGAICYGTKAENCGGAMVCYLPHFYGEDYQSVCVTPCNADADCADAGGSCVLDSQGHGTCQDDGAPTGVCE